MQCFPLFPGARSRWLSRAAGGRCRPGLGSAGEDRALPVSSHMAAARGWGLFAQAGAAPVQIRGANGSRAVQTCGGWTRVPWKPGCTAACHCRLKRLLGFPGLGRESSNYRLIRGVLPWSPAMSTESRSAPARLAPWELLSTSPPLVSAAAAGSRGCRGARGMWPWPWPVQHGEPQRVTAKARCGRNRRGTCSPKALTLSGSLLASASLSRNNVWLHQAGELGSAPKPSCSR